MSDRPVSCRQSPGVGIQAGAWGGADKAAWGLSQSRVCNWERVCNPRPGQAIVRRWDIWEDDWVLWRAGPEIPGGGGRGRRRGRKEMTTAFGAEEPCRPAFWSLKDRGAPAPPYLGLRKGDF